MLIVASLLFILRKHDMPGILFIMSGFILLLFANSSGDLFEFLLMVFVLLTAVGIVELVVAAIAVYPAFVVYSQRNLPKF